MSSELDYYFLLSSLVLSMRLTRPSPPSLAVPLLGAATSVFWFWLIGTSRPAVEEEEGEAPNPRLLSPLLTCLFHPGQECNGDGCSVSASPSERSE